MALRKLGLQANTLSLFLRFVVVVVGLTLYKVIRLLYPFDGASSLVIASMDATLR